MVNFINFLLKERLDLIGDDLLQVKHHGALISFEHGLQRVSSDLFVEKFVIGDEVTGCCAFDLVQIEPVLKACVHCVLNREMRLQFVYLNSKALHEAEKPVVAQHLLLGQFRVYMD